MSDLKAHATTVRAQFRSGQNIWRRPSIGGLLKRIDELEAEVVAAERRGWERARERAGQLCHDSEKKVRKAVENRALTNDGAFDILAFLGSYRDDIRFMQYQPEQSAE